MEAPLNNIRVGDTLVVTCDNWFHAPDGVMYKAVFGTVRAVRTAEESLGVRPNGKSTNWYLEIGNMIIAGCQIHYLVKALTFNRGRADEHTVKDGVLIEYQRTCQIYDADQEAT